MSGPARLFSKESATKMPIWQAIEIEVFSGLAGQRYISPALLTGHFHVLATG